MEVSQSKIDQATAIIGDGGISDCVVTVEGRNGEVVELNYQEWLQAGKLIQRFHGMSPVAIWQDPVGYGDKIETVFDW